MLEKDHDMLITLVENVKNLTEGQNKFHKEMKDAMDDLRNNYSGQISNHETRLNKLETSNTRTTVLLSVGIGILTILVSILVYHIFN